MLGIRYTADWDMYYLFFKQQNEKTDFIFYTLSKLFAKYHYNYNDLYSFHIVMIVIIYYILITRFSRHFFYIFLAYITLDYVHFTNQIRYYLGFPILMIGFYYLFYKKKYIFSILLIILSILCHSALSILLIFIPIYFIPKKKYFTYILRISLFVFVIVYYIFNTGLGKVLQHFGAYLEKDNVSSFVGGLFNALPYIFYLLFLILISRKLLKKYDRADNPTFEFVFKITFFSFIFLPGALILQIVGHRYLFPFAIFWIIYFLYLIQPLPNKEKFKYFFMFFLLNVLCGFTIYILPDVLNIDNLFMKELKHTMKSINYLRGYFY
ncbi:EpsG family protein [Epilithonimonas pallida]|uniref:EpsG family protein n=2 Tax=Epilithonimonas pallida TaxID=373671 RepID=A0ABY1R4Z3_9FLAO|nr:EpsG family protein [Epilithonimonas pallida]